MASPAITASVARRLFVAPLFIFSLLLADTTLSAASEAFQPESAREVLLTIPAAERESQANISDARRAFALSPDSAEAAAKLASAYLSLHEKLGDPRYIGYAASVMSEFEEVSGSKPLPARIRIINADLLQAQHQFAEAEAALKDIIKASPEQWNAWLMLASIAETRGNYDLARRACAQLVFAGKTLSGLTCSASVASVRGQSAEALRQMELALAEAGQHSPEIIAWSHVVAAEIALRIDRTQKAEALLETALSIRDSLYTRLALADLLIQQERYDDASSVIEDLPASDAVLIRRARIAGQASPRDLPVLARQLERRVEAMRLRGEVSHGREEAQIALLLAAEPASALEAALRNWDKQRESIDAMLLLEAAIAAQKPEAARPVLEWMETNESDDVRLLRLRTTLERNSS